MSRHPRLLLPVLALALGLTACGGGQSTAVLEDNLEAQSEALDALRNRVSELSDEVGAVRSQDPMSGLGDLSTELEDLLTRLEQVESTVAEQATSGEDVTAQVAAELGTFGERLDELVAEVRDLTTQVTGVRTDLDELEARFSEHADDPFAHSGGDTGGE